MAHGNTSETPAQQRARVNNPWNRPPEPWRKGEPTPEEQERIRRWHGLADEDAEAAVGVPQSERVGQPPHFAQATARMHDMVRQELERRHLTPLPWPEACAPNSYVSLGNAVNMFATRLPRLERPAWDAPSTVIARRAAGGVAVPARMVDWRPVARRAAGRLPFPLPVNAGSSDGTIWGSPEANARFRAWHDATHLELAAGFEEADELRVADEQRRVAMEVYRLDPAELAMLWAETRGQDSCKRRIGRFPKHQARFVGRAMAVGIAQAIEEERDA